MHSYNFPLKFIQYDFKFYGEVDFDVDCPRSIKEGLQLSIFKYHQRFDQELSLKLDDYYFGFNYRYKPGKMDAFIAVMDYKPYESEQFRYSQLDKIVMILHAKPRNVPMILPPVPVAAPPLLHVPVPIAAHVLPLLPPVLPAGPPPLSEAEEKCSECVVHSGNMKTFIETQKKFIEVVEDMNGYSSRRGTGSNSNICRSRNSRYRPY